MSALELTAVDDDLLVWAFLAEVADADRARLPWLILQEWPGPLVTERFAVPRLVSDESWSCQQSQITLDNVPIYRKSPSRRQQPELVVALLALDIDGLTVRQLLQRDRPTLDAGRIGTLEKETAERKVRRQRRQMQWQAAAAGALPWAAFESGKLPPRWRQHPRFLAALEQWQRDASDPAHEAALFCIRLAAREWSGLPAPDQHWGEASTRGPRYKPLASRTITEYVHTDAHASILFSGRSVGPGDCVQPAELTAEDQVLLDEGFLVDVDAFDGTAATGATERVNSAVAQMYMTDEPCGSRARKLAVRRLEVSAREAHEATFEEWCARLLHPQGGRSYMASVERYGGLDELRAAWRRTHR